MAQVENWGYNYENESMKGYVLYALKLIEKEEPKAKLTADQKQALLNALNWATSDLTAQEAFDYYCNS